MNKRFICVLIPVIALEGCSVINSLENISLEMDQRKCERFGFVRGTDAYANCMLQQQALQQESYEREQFIDAIQGR
ncbi:MULTISPECIES: hypothetical protein [Burkholderia]|jgi:hypothetical protein|uniref:hypothetical protein n=1 Tax=Burkholderia TaxID=32008 RepID=UPI00158E7739|nr:hypothetical protein [Burkholderia ambifaria]